MIKEIEIALSPEIAFDDSIIKLKAAEKLNIQIDDITAISKLRRSIDSRGRKSVYRLFLRVYVNESPQKDDRSPQYLNSSHGKEVLIIGFGPAGMFSALRLLELGYKPIIVERGKDVQARRRDLRAIQQEHIVNPDSNYCFGEGGAGTYSDGKLYTRSTKRGDVKKILSVFIMHGAAEDILIDAHPHIGSNRLPEIIQNIRNTILEHGGEIHFESRVTDFIIHNNVIKGIILQTGKEILADAVVLATGHSARDIYYLLNSKGIKLESKPFAMGVRIEHPQPLIDEIQYHTKDRSPDLPSASYSLTCQVDSRGVFSFCMCPGGIIVPASTSPGELVLNGMSYSRRNSQFANSGFVVTIEKDDLKDYSTYGEFDGLEYQKFVEKTAFEAGGNSPQSNGQTAPAQRVTDFLNNKLSTSLPESSYIPGIISSPIHEVLPLPIVRRLQKGLIEFNKRMRGYITDEAQILAAETRTSSPIRIPRNPETLMHVEVEGLFPSGEGAGYAGGIVSAAIDGDNCANAVSRYLNK